jgi:hypothetical protein
MNEGRGCILKGRAEHLHTEAVRDVAVNAHGLMASAGHDGRVCITDLSGGLGRMTRRHVLAGVVGSIAWRGDEKTAGFTTDDGTYAVLDPRAARMVVQTYTAQRAHAARQARLYAHATLEGDGVALGCVRPYGGLGGGGVGGGA